MGKDIEKDIDDVAGVAELEPIVDGLKKVAKFTADEAKKTEKVISDAQADVSGKFHALEQKMNKMNETNEKGMHDVLDRIDLINKRTSFAGRAQFDQDDASVLKQAVPERFINNFNAYENVVYDGSEGIYSDPRYVAAKHAWLNIASKLQLRKFDPERESLRGELDKLEKSFQGVYKVALGGLTDAQGGYAVPNIVGNEVLKIIRDASDIYNKARQIPMTSDTLSFPDEATAVTTNWSNTDGTTLTPGEPVFGVKTLNARKLVGRATFSLELLDDANVAIIPFLQSCFAERMGGELDAQAMEGSGAPFTGVSGATSVVDAVVTTNGTIGQTLYYSSSTATAASLVRIYTAAQEQTSIKGGTFVCGPALYSAILGLVDNNGQPVIRLGTVEGQPNQTLFGRPIIVSARLPKVTLGAGTNSVGGLYYGPMNALLFGTRQGFRWDVTDQVSWATYSADARMVGRFGYVVGVPTAWAKNLGIRV